MTWPLLNDLPEIPEDILDLIWPDIGNPMVSGYTGEQKEFAARLARAIRRDRLTREILGEDEGCTQEFEQHEFLDAWEENGCAEPSQKRARAEYQATQAHALSSMLDSVALQLARTIVEGMSQEQFAEVQEGKVELQFSRILDEEDEGFALRIRPVMLKKDL